MVLLTSPGKLWYVLLIYGAHFLEFWHYFLNNELSSTPGVAAQRIETSGENLGVDPGGAAGVPRQRATIREYLRWNWLQAAGMGVLQELDVEVAGEVASPDIRTVMYGSHVPLACTDFVNA